MNGGTPELEVAYAEEFVINRDDVNLLRKLLK